MEVLETGEDGGKLGVGVVHCGTEVCYNLFVLCREVFWEEGEEALCGCLGEADVDVRWS